MQDFDLKKTAISLSHGPISFSEQLNYPLSLSYLVVIICLRGEATLSVNFTDYIINKNTLTVLSSDDVVIVQQKTDEFSAYIYGIDRSLASEIAYHLPNTLFGFLHDYPVLQMTSEQRTQLEFWMLQLNYFLEQSSTYLDRIICNHFQNLFLHLVNYIDGYDQLRKKKISRKEEHCWKFWELIGQYAKTNRDVAFYADLLHITPFYLAQISKSHLNDLPKDLINRQVILEIKNLLLTTDKSIGTIAEELNFVDPSYMGRFFKRETGVSLSMYRK
ncbi:helix-turn-helix domain-containing protein [Myroides sp. C8-3]|uniref:AraC family transcriptional regulator n=1 Tax=Myroides sp. C8-3 TaxID=3400533 RepID=UPI003D2F7D57